MNFILALTVGLLVFLVVDMFEEAQEVALSAPAFLDARCWCPVLAILTAGLLSWSGSSLRGIEARACRLRLALSYQIAIGIGLAQSWRRAGDRRRAFAIGEAALGVFLIVGFTLHNVTEGSASPRRSCENKPSLWHFVALAAIAGGPAISAPGSAHSPIRRSGPRFSSPSASARSSR